MKKDIKSTTSWTICTECQGQGKKSRRPKKKVRLRYQIALEQFEKSNGEGIAPVRPKGHLDSCKNCSGSGLIPNSSTPIADKENYPHVAIIGGGMGVHYLVHTLWKECQPTAWDLSIYFRRPIFWDDAFTVMANPWTAIGLVKYGSFKMKQRARGGFTMSGGFKSITEIFKR